MADRHWVRAGCTACCKLSVFGSELVYARSVWNSRCRCIISLVGVFVISQPPFLLSLFGGSSQHWTHSHLLGIGLGLGCKLFALALTQ
jgi:hypothetical protein